MKEKRGDTMNRVGRRSAILGQRRAKFGVILALAVLLSGCAGYTATVIGTGEVLDSIGKQFVQTGKTYDTLLDKGYISPQEYRAWAAFVPKFQLAYGRAVDMWNVAERSRGVEGKGDLKALVDNLKSELLFWYLDSVARLKQISGG